MLGQILKSIYNEFLSKSLKDKIRYNQQFIIILDLVLKLFEKHLQFLGCLSQDLSAFVFIYVMSKIMKIIMNDISYF